VLLKERGKDRNKHEEEDVSSYWMILSENESAGN
jgi:hypothetical protein